jgi:hypothetical protein
MYFGSEAPAGHERNWIETVPTQVSQSIAPRPQSHTRNTGSSFLEQAIAWTVLLGLASLPRLGIVGLWIFGHQLGDAFSSWIIPALGFLFLPWTTLAYALLWGITSDVVSGWEWIVVGVAFLTDVLFTLWARSCFRE